MTIMKTTQIVRFVAFVFSILLSSSLFAQTNVSANDLSKDWSLLKEQNGAKLFVKREACSINPSLKPLDYLLVKVVNENGDAVNSSFQIGLLFNNGCRGCEQNVETLRTVIVEANSSKECDCSFKNGEMSLLIKNPNHSDDAVFEGIQLIDFKLD